MKFGIHLGKHILKRMQNSFVILIQKIYVLCNRGIMYIHVHCPRKHSALLLDTSVNALGRNLFNLQNL